jgi:hypothetical protein
VRWSGFSVAALLDKSHRVLLILRHKSVLCDEHVSEEKGWNDGL